MTNQAPDRGDTLAGREGDRPGPGPTVTALKRARREAGLTATDLARKLGVSVNTVTSWEAGRRKPSSARLEAWADVLGLRIVLMSNRALAS